MRVFRLSGVGLLNWTPPVLLLAPAPPYDRIWYPAPHRRRRRPELRPRRPPVLRPHAPGTGVRDFMSVPVTFTAKTGGFAVP
ncbi:hypothetical protein GCM10009827_088110 [Dactylosporangium maewongense]|uniref:Secreted protein n=1 Tax=Dactylosporangium maewongense TaxID=634393 RepID=A0ABN2C775_9ACTN